MNLHKMFIFFVVMATSVLCRRHHHFHYHLTNSSDHQAEVNNFSAKNQNEKLTTIDVSDTSDIETFTPYSKHNTGRHVCSSRKTVQHPVKTVQSFCKPTYKKYKQRCNDNQLCTGVKLVFETAYRDVYTTKSTQQVEFACCPGWTQISKNSHGCNKPFCSTPCQNGGLCIKPDICQCQKGFRGKNCEIDIDECTETKPCDQICRNTLGSFKCDCREFFVLDSDGQSCKKESEGPDHPDQDLEYELLNKRLYKLETMMNDMADHTVPKDNLEIMKHKIETLTDEVKILKARIYEMENTHRDIRVMKNKISVLEHKANKMDELSKRYDTTGVKNTSYSNRIYN